MLLLPSKNGFLVNEKSFLCFMFTGTFLIAVYLWVPLKNAHNVLMGIEKMALLYSQRGNLC